MGNQNSMCSPCSEDNPRETVNIPRRNIVEPKNTDGDRSSRTNDLIVSELNESTALDCQGIKRNNDNHISLRSEDSSSEDIDETKSINLISTLRTNQSTNNQNIMVHSKRLISKTTEENKCIIANSLFQNYEDYERSQLTDCIWKRKF